MLGWVVIASNAAGWGVEAHSALAVLLKVPCRAGWVGKVLVVRKKGVVHAYGHIAREGSVREVFKATMSCDSSARWLYRMLRRHYGAMQTSALALTSMFAKADYTSIIEDVVWMVAYETQMTPVPEIKKNSDNLWTVIMRNALFIIKVNHLYTELCYRDTCKKITSSCWSSYTDVGSLSYALFSEITSIVQSSDSPEAGPLQPPFCPALLAGVPSHDD